MRKLSFLFVIVFVFTMIQISFAESDIPDLKGTWIMQVKSTRHHKTQKDNPKIHHDVKTGIAEFELKITINKQDGAHFSGTSESAKLKETISGVIGFDNKTLYFVDNDGMAFGKIVGPDKIERIYLHVTEYDSAAARGIMIREPVKNRKPLGIK